jgi:hypothetical protein
MVNLSRFETNPFYDEVYISIANFHQFATDHTNRLKANNPGGAFSAIIADTQSIYDQFNTVFGSKSVEEALRKGATVGIGDSVGEILIDARKLEKQVAFLFDKGSPKYISFFPKGLTELNEAGKGEWPGILARFKAATVANAADLGAATVATWAGHEANYVQATADQEGKKGTVDQLRTQLLADRKALARQMFINLHTIVIYFIDKPGSLTNYFDQSIVDRRQSSASDGSGRWIIVVTDHSGNPLQNVLMDIVDSGDQNVLLGQKTDVNGRYQSPPLPIGTYKVTFRLDGYVTRTHKFEVFDDRDPENEVQLTRE